MNGREILIGFIVCAVCVSGAMAGNTYYVDAASGSDTYAGSSVQPWATMNKAMVTAVGGDLVLVRPGDYGQVVVGSSHNLGNAVDGYITYRADAATVAVRPADWWHNPIDPSFGNPANRAVLRKLQFYNTLAGNYLEFDGFDIVQSGSMAHGFLVGGKDNISHVRIKNLNIFGVWDDFVNAVYFQQSAGVSAYFHDILVDGCTVRDVSTGLRLGGRSGSNIVFSNNHVYHTDSSTVGMLGGVSEDVILLEHNHLQWQEPVLAWGSYTHGSGIAIRREHIHIKRNVINNHGSSRSIYIYTDATISANGYNDLLIENNLIYDPQNYAIEVNHIGQNIVIRNNTLVGYPGSNWGLRYYVMLLLKYHSSSDGSGVSYYNNVIVGGMGGQMNTNDEGKNIVWSLPHSYPNRIRVGSSSIVLSGLSSMFGSYPQDYFEGSGNFFVGGPLFDTYSFLRPGGSPHGVVMFDEYQLAEGSAGIGFGDAANAPAVDINGNPRDPVSPCVGAFEFGAGQPRVVGRYVFYNGSAFDGGDVGANAGDDGSIAVDKVALRYGQTATFANYTSYSKGINGVMIDLMEAENSGGISASDFEFTVGNDSAVDFWPVASGPVSVAVREGEGISGSDRVTIIWADGAIKGKWLSVKVLATANTGLASVDEFFFGNAVGETGNRVSDAIVDASDEVGCRNNPRHFLQPAFIDDVYDFNRDGKVDATDEILSRNNVTTVMTGLELIGP